MRRLALALTALAACCGAQELKVTGDRPWIDTGLDIKAGETLKFTATGAMGNSALPKFGPEGATRGWRDLLLRYPLNNASRGALIGRLGEHAAAQPFLIGAAGELTAPAAGRLFLGVNFPAGQTSTGEFVVTLTRTAAAARTLDGVKLPKLTQAMIDQIPRRVQDAEGTPGDRVNFVLAGSDEQVKQALQQAGWVIVDRDSKSSVIRGILGSLNKQAYLTMPMSELLLFGRVQDFGYAMSDPIATVATRHHFRLWRAPFTADGVTVWAGAGTHDIGFDRDQRNNSITHKIDPEVDKEREFIGKSLQLTGMIAKTEYLTPKDPVTEAKTAHGGEFRSDGRTLILYFHPQTK